jgi:DnaJ-class molecular chaperone
MTISSCKGCAGSGFFAEMLNSKPIRSMPAPKPCLACNGTGSVPNRAD